MTPRRVIEDSDEEDSSFDIPEKMNPLVTMTKVGVNHDTSSTDPMQFRAVYEEHLGQVPVDDQLQACYQSPAPRDLVSQSMSSSSVSSTRKLKRSKTINVSSLASISESNLSNRSELMRKVDERRQVMAPGGLGDPTWKDPWEVPTSSDSERSSHMDAKVRSRNAERNGSLRTYGRPIRRTHTFTHIDHDQEGRVHETLNQRRFVSTQEDDDFIPVLPKRKRRKSGSSMSGDTPEMVIQDSLPTLSKVVLSASGITCTSPGCLTGQVQRCASEHRRPRTNDLVTDHIHESNSPPLATQTVTDVIVRDSYPMTRSSAVQASRKTPRPTAIALDTLTDEQKLQYDVISVVSTQSRRSSQSEMMEKVDSNMKYAADSSTGPNDALLPKFLLGTVKASDNTILLSSSPPVSDMDRKVKRTKPEGGSKQSASSVSTFSHSKVTKRRGRSKTIAPGERPLRCKALVDELSLTSLECLRRNCSKEVSTIDGKKRAHGQSEEELIGADDPHNLQDTGLKKDQYQLQSSLRRSKSTPMQSSNDAVDLSSPKIGLVRKKASKATYHTVSHANLGEIELFTETRAQASAIQNDQAMAILVSKEAIAEDQICLTETDMHERVRDYHSVTGKLVDAQTLATKSTAPVLPKRRSRRKTSDIMSNKANGVSTQTADLVSVKSKKNEVERDVLHETNGNKQLSQETTSNPLAMGTLGLSLVKTPAEATTSIPLQGHTPTKNSKTGPDQHSPLQSGKVPYRVGLSKRMRIAPLLKIIRK